MPPPAPSEPETEVVIEDEPVAELDQTDNTMATEENEATATSDNTAAQADEPKVKDHKLMS